MTNLTRTDTYNEIIPDEAIETCLKVIRTIRNYCLHPNVFDADGAVTLSHAHAKIVDLTKLAEEAERAEHSKAIAEPDDHTIPDPDFAVE